VKLGIDTILPPAWRIRRPFDRTRQPDLDRAHHTSWAPRVGNVGCKAGFVNRRKSGITGDQDTGDHDTGDHDTGESPGSPAITTPAITALSIAARPVKDK
jgi:hypothetical protein